MLGWALVMPPARKTRGRGYLGRGSLLSLLLHAQLLLPLAIAAFIYGGREEAQRAEEVDVGFEAVADDQLPKPQAMPERHRQQVRRQGSERTLPAIALPVPASTSG